jgi:hypothetical protein
MESSDRALLLSQVEGYVRSCLGANQDDAVSYKFVARNYNRRFARLFPGESVFDVLGRDGRFFTYTHGPTGSRWIGLRAGIRDIVGDGLELTEEQVIDAVCRGKPDQAARRRKVAKV